MHFLSHFLFPSGRTAGKPDEMFSDQASALSNRGYSFSICPDSVFAGVMPLRDVPRGAAVVYRGWMATADEYANFVLAVERCGAIPMTSTRQYLATHHLPRWYPLLAEYTPETCVFPEDAALEIELPRLGWTAYFIKDYVKSLKTGRGSIVRDPSEASAVVSELREYRGKIEGGICVRRVETFLPNSERRFFVLRKTAYSPDSGPIPSVVDECAARIDSPFFSVDVATRDDGVVRIIEIGDGQVSDLVGWNADRFASIWRENEPT